VRFGFRGIAGQYTLSITNGGAGSRAYLASFTVTAGQANTDTEQTFVIPGDVTGAWATDNTGAMQLNITLCGGSTYTGVAGWQAGNVFSLPGQVNGLSAVNNTFELFDVGLYADPNGTGRPPAWQAPNYADEERNCQRYWKYISGALLSGYNGAGGVIYQTVAISPTMRTSPTGTFSGIIYSNGSGLTTNGLNTDMYRTTMSITAAGSGYVNYNLTMNARM